MRASSTADSTEPSGSAARWSMRRRHRLLLHDERGGLGQHARGAGRLAAVRRPRAQLAARRARRRGRAPCRLRAQLARPWCWPARRGRACARHAV